MQEQILNRVKVLLPPAIAVVLIFYIFQTAAAPQNWNRQTCNNTRCLGDEVCVMETGRCDYRGQCARYPACRIPKRTPYAGVMSAPTLWRKQNLTL
ncbi:uncharacterized protein [Periplaneta americana]|uniref:uncharacterized protein isoform X2 n=1 Tax=Periplaneta americana TaxID=6978 RepID=UPI0037E96CCC